MDEEIVVHARWKPLLLFLCTLAFVVCGVWIIFLGMNEPLKGFLWIAAGIASVGFFGLCGGYILYRLLVPSPILAVTEEGILDNASAMGAGLLRWDEIENVYIFETHGQRFVGIVPKDIEAVVARQNAFKAWLMRLNLKNGFAAISIPQSVLPMSVDDLAAALRGNYEERTA